MLLPNILRRCLFFICFIFLLPQKAEGALMNCQYHVFGFYNETASIPHNYIHPLWKSEHHNYVALTVQEEDILKVAFYYDNTLEFRFILFYTYNPSKSDCRGMPAKFIYHNEQNGIEFNNGTILYSYFPPDARPLGTSEWMYEMRWRRVYKNYYFVTVFRGTGEVVKEDLMTEKDGKDLTPVLGDSSVDRDLEDMGGSISADMVLVSSVKEHGQIKYIRYNLIPVYEKDLPPDFPEGVVCWLP